MKIIVTSDIHRNKKIIDEVIYNYDGDIYLDCGDSELSNYELKNFETVKGNCDYNNFPNYRIVEIDDYLNLFVTHSHLYSLNEMIEKAKENNCLILLYGHTHIKKHDIIESIHVINPGSITKPRNKDSNTFLQIDYDENTKEINFDFIKLGL